MLANTASLDSSSRLLASFQRYGPAVACAVAGFLSAFTISLGGLMPVGELLLLCIFPWVLIRAFFRRGWPTRLQQLGWFRLLIVLAAFTAAGYVASDLYRSTPFENLTRGWARVAFLLIDLVAIAYLIDTSWVRLRLFILALFAGSVVSAVISGPLNGEWWKFGVGYATTAVVLFAFAGRALALQVIVAIVMGTISLLLGSRSLGATCLLTAGLFGLHYAHGVWRPIALLGSLGAVVALIFAGNSVIIENQDHSSSNVERQSMIEMGLETVLTSPLLGEGSWFTATHRISRLESKRQGLDASFRGYSEEEMRKLSIHSQLLAALAEAGIFGGAFFLGLGALLAKTVRTLTRHSVPYRAFIFFIVLTGGWNLLMSPFSGVARVEISLLVCTCLLVILQRQGELSEDYRE